MEFRLLLVSAFLFFPFTAAASMSIPRIGLRGIPVFECDSPNPQAMDLCLKKSAIVKYGGLNVYVGHSSASGHGEKSAKIFARLPELRHGDLLRIGRKVYEVVSSRIVEPDAMWMLQTEEGEVRLMTCYPVGTARERLFVTAKIKTSAYGVLTTLSITSSVP